MLDVVIASHYHGDHINGLLKADNSIAFPKAEILVPAKEHNFWMDDGEMSRASKPRVVAGFKNVRRLMTAEIIKRVRTYEWNKEVIPGVTAIGTPGHARSHVSVIASGAKAVYAQADVTLHRFCSHAADWHFMLDVEPVEAEATRRKVYDMLVAERMLVQGLHYPFKSQIVCSQCSGAARTPVPANGEVSTARKSRQLMSAPAPARRLYVRELQGEAPSRHHPYKGTAPVMNDLIGGMCGRFGVLPRRSAISRPARCAPSRSPAPSASRYADVPTFDESACRASRRCFIRFVGASRHTEGHHDKLAPSCAS